MQMAMPYLKDYDGKTLILAGDMPLLTQQTLQTLIDKTPKGGAALLSSIAENPTGYGRVLRDDHGRVVRLSLIQI